MILEISKEFDTSLYAQLGISAARATEIGEHVRTVIIAHITACTLPGGSALVSNGMMLKDCIECCNTLEEAVFCTNLHVRIMVSKPRSENFICGN